MNRSIMNCDCGNCHRQRTKMSKQAESEWARRITHLGLKELVVESVWTSIQYRTKGSAQIAIITVDGLNYVFKSIYNTGYNYIENFKGRIVSTSFLTSPIPILTLKTENDGILRLDTGYSYGPLHFIPVKKLDARVKWTELLCDQRIVFGTNILKIYNKRIKDNNYKRLDIK